MGPLTLEARRYGLFEVLAIQAEVCQMAAAAGQPPYSLINLEEKNRILELIESETWPEGWSGMEPKADEPFIEWRPDGTIQPSLFGGN